MMWGSKLISNYSVNSLGKFLGSAGAITTIGGGSYGAYRGYQEGGLSGGFKGQFAGSAIGGSIPITGMGLLGATTKNFLGSGYSKRSWAGIAGIGAAAGVLGYAMW